MKIIEEYTCSKSGNERDNEDALFYRKDLVAIIDGTTGKRVEPIEEITSGQFAKNVLMTALEEVDLKMSPREILFSINNCLEQEIKRREFEQRPSATLVFYNHLRREIVRYGDSNLKIGCDVYLGTKEIDIMLAQERCRFLEKEILRGKTVEELLVCDTGRQHIMQQLITMHKYANKREKLGYPVLDGAAIIDSFIEVFPVPENTEIVLASDGYPYLGKDLKESEIYLSNIIKEDPLCMRRYKGTKGIGPKQKSFDDRTYVRLLT